jgi:hypothetical protein
MNKTETKAMSLTGSRCQQDRSESRDSNKRKRCHRPSFSRAWEGRTSHGQTDAATSLL